MTPLLRTVRAALTRGLNTFKAGSGGGKDGDVTAGT
jgi:hypothetical protein